MIRTILLYIVGLALTIGVPIGTNDACLKMGNLWGVAWFLVVGGACVWAMYALIRKDLRNGAIAG